MGSDQGVVVTVNGAKTWSSWYNQPTAQFYHVSTDNAFFYWAYGAQQDSGAAMQATQSSTARYRNNFGRSTSAARTQLAPDPEPPG